VSIYAIWLIDAEPLIKKFSDREEKVKSDEETLRIREQEISRREKSLEDHLKNQKLTQSEIDLVTNPDAVF
jgi:hypothetical protein